MSSLEKINTAVSTWANIRTHTLTTLTKENRPIACKNNCFDEDGARILKCVNDLQLMVCK
jgi:hypothetical protein